MTREEIDRIWRDPRSRKWGCYYAKNDPRLIVPRRWGGWTANFAHARAIPATLFLIAILAVPAWVMRSQGAKPATLFLTLGISIAVVCVLCHHLASRTE